MFQLLGPFHSEQCQLVSAVEPLVVSVCGCSAEGPTAPAVRGLEKLHASPALGPEGELTASGKLTGETLEVWQENRPGNWQG